MKDTKKIDEQFFDDLNAILPFFDEFGLEEHFKTDYGLESEYLDPWQLYDNEDAKEAKFAAKQCLKFSETIYEHYFPKTS